MYVEDDLVFYNVSINSQNDLFDFMADKLISKKYVNEGFRDAIKKREKEYPTGLELDGLNVAITHTESEYAKSKKLIIIKPEETITFRNIENFEPIEVDLVFGIVLNNTNGHLEILKKISLLFQEKKLIEEVIEIKSKDMLFSFMHKHFNL